MVVPVKRSRRRSTSPQTGTLSKKGEIAGPKKRDWNRSDCLGRDLLKDSYMHWRRKKCAKEEGGGGGGGGWGGGGGVWGWVGGVLAGWAGGLSLVWFVEVFGLYLDCFLAA